MKWKFHTVWTESRAYISLSLDEKKNRKQKIKFDAYIEIMKSTYTWPIRQTHIYIKASHSQMRKRIHMRIRLIEWKKKITAAAQIHMNRTHKTCYNRIFSLFIPLLLYVISFARNALSEMMWSFPSRVSSISITL